MHSFKVASLMALTLCLAAPAQAGDSTKSPMKMSPSEIAEFNEGLESSDPAYIKCQRVAETGSLIGKKRVCRSNAQWNALATSANRETREMIEGMARSGGTNGN